MGQSIIGNEEFHMSRTPSNVQPRKCREMRSQLKPFLLKEDCQNPRTEIYFQFSTLNPHDINERFSFNSFSHSCHLIPNNGLAAFLHINIHTTHNSSIHPKEGLTLETSALKLLTVAIYVINSVDNTKLP